jgi:hypothetical protein
VFRNVIRRLEAVYGPSPEGELSTSHRGLFHSIMSGI